jgi:hypothetical protein
MAPGYASACAPLLVERPCRDREAQRAVEVQAWHLRQLLPAA